MAVAITNTRKVIRREIKLATVILTSSQVFEAEVLQGFRGAAIEAGCLLIVVPLLGEITLRDPGCGPVTRRLRLLEGALRIRERGLRRFEKVPLEE
jgi:hypothetical protein